MLLLFAKQSLTLHVPHHKTPSMRQVRMAVSSEGHICIHAVYDAYSTAKVVCHVVIKTKDGTGDN